MLDLLRTRLAQGRQTLPIPAEGVTLPERFRGRPSLDCTACAGRPCVPESVPLVSGLVRREAGAPPKLDVGAALFAPEEAVGDRACGVSFTPDYRLSARTRDGLVSATGELESVAALGDAMRSLLGRSLRLRSVAAGSCGGCEAELTALGNVVFDLARFGIQFVASPRHADGLVVTGVVNDNMRDALLATYEAIPDPRIVIAVGACAVSGGVFADAGDHGAARGVGDIVPVDLWIAGCPPHPLTLLDGLLRLLGRITDGPAGTAR